MFVSNLSRDIPYPVRRSYMDFLSLFSQIVGILPLIGHGQFLTNHFKVVLHLLLNLVLTESQNIPPNWNTLFCVFSWTLRSVWGIMNCSPLFQIVTSWWFFSIPPVESWARTFCPFIPNDFYNIFPSLIERRTVSLSPAVPANKLSISTNTKQV
jgi:hypothetical protein